MDSIDEVGLSKRGGKLMHSLLDKDGKMIHLVRTARGESVPMLAGDIADLIAGRTTGSDINHLDRGARMKTPWPTVIRALAAATEECSLTGTLSR